MKKFFKVLFKLFLFFFFCIVLLGGYLILRYRNWEKDFESGIRQEYVITKESIQDVSVEERLTQFVLSSEDTQFLEFKVKEFGAILFTVLNNYTNEEITVERMYIEPQKAKWKIYIEFSYKEVRLWASMDLNKDDMQTAQLYTKELFVGPFPIHTFTDWDDTINRGIGDSLVTLNENGFVGRYIENIELLEDSIIFKGSRY